MNFKYLLSILFISLLFTKSLFSQKEFIANQNKSEIVIIGTSNIHDWEMEVGIVKSSIQSSSNSIEDINQINLEIPVRSLKSGQKKMEKNTYEVLNEAEHANILFKSNRITVGDTTYHAYGDLTIAGKTKQVKIPFKLSENKGVFKLTCDYKINMSVYQIEPPTALFGILKVGEIVNVAFNISYLLN